MKHHKKRRFNPLFAWSAVVVLAVVAIGVGLSDAASTGLSLSGGQTAAVTCAGKVLDTSRVSKTDVNLTCVASTAPTTTTTVAPTTTTTTVAPTTTTTTSTPPGGSCTTPVYTTSNAEGTDNTDPNDGYEYYWVNNDAWSGSHGPQTLYVCNQSSWYATSNQPNDGGQVQTYPDTEYDVGGRDAGSTTPISGFTAINSTFSEAYPSAGGWDAAYDLWTDTWTNETMVWNQWAGNNGYWANCAAAASSESYCGVPQNAQNINIGGVLYNFVANGPSNTDCTTANESSCELMFFRQSQVTSGSVNLLAVFQWEVANGYAKSSDIPTQLEYGVEVSYTTGTETFPMNGLTFSVSG